MIDDEPISLKTIVSRQGMGDLRGLSIIDRENRDAQLVCPLASKALRRAA